MKGSTRTTTRFGHFCSSTTTTTTTTRQKKIQPYDRKFNRRGSLKSEQKQTGGGAGAPSICVCWLYNGSMKYYTNHHERL